MALAGAKPRHTNTDLYLTSRAVDLLRYQCDFFNGISVLSAGRMHSWDFFFFFPTEKEEVCDCKDAGTFI